MIKFNGVKYVPLKGDTEKVESEAFQITSQAASFRDYLYVNKRLKDLRKIAARWISNPDSPGYFIGIPQELWEAYPTFFPEELRYSEKYPIPELPTLWVIQGQLCKPTIGRTPKLSLEFIPFAIVKPLKNAP